jgi:Domain of unknown function (DUF222)
MSNLASAVDELLALDGHALPGPALAEQLVEARRQINRLEAGYLGLLETFDRTGGASADRGSTAAWIRTHLHRSPNTASREVHLARDLADALPVTKAAMVDGDISPAHAQIIGSLRPAIRPEALSNAEPHIVDYARACTPKELRAVAAHIKHTYAPDKATRDEKDDYDNRSLHASATIDGIGIGKFTLHPAGFETLMTALHAASRPVTGDDRTPAQRRADALISIAEIALRSGDSRSPAGSNPTSASS